MASQETTHNPQVMLELAFDLEGFLSSWHHCDQMANYAGFYTSFGKPDVFSYENIMSTITNEILETIYWRNAGQGTVSMVISEQQVGTCIEATIPVNAESECFYRNTVQRLSQGDPNDLYLELLLSGGGEQGVLSLSELAANYDAKLNLSTGQDTAEIRLSLTVVI